MNSRLPWWILLWSAVASSGAPGCLYCCRKPCPRALLPAPACAPCASGIAPGLPVPAQPPPALVPPAPSAPISVPTESRSFAPTAPPPVAPSWQPGTQGPGVRLTVPQPTTPAAPHESARLNPPEPASPAPAKPAVVEESSSTPLLPSGIAQFSQALEQVATGLRPHLEGLDWLQKNGYRTVLHIHAPGEVVDADRPQVEKRGLKYVSLSFAPDTLAQNILDEFKRLVEDQGAYPLFVYDKDGMLAGGLWYLYFRTVAKESDEVARTKAARLGLKDEHQAMWSAIRKFLGSALDK